MSSTHPRVTPLPVSYAPEGVRRFGNYYLLRKLAEGGMAEIFLAKQVGAEGFERNIVIKRMLKHLSSLPEFVGMFLDEARLAARLSHPNVVQINDLGLADGCYFIGMEYLAGEDFSTVVRRAAQRGEYVPLAVVLKVVLDAANGLHFAHEFTDETGRRMNIVHRDISPSNILVTYQGTAKVLDFGIAKAESRVTHTTAGVVKGKYLYMAPEQARGDAVDARSDVFSLGVCLYEALTNARPFSKDNDLAVLNAVLRAEFTPPSRLRRDLPPELERIVLKAMAADANERYASAGALAHDLELYLGTSTSASGGSHVANYLKSLFGEEQIARKTRVPTLQSLAEAGVVIPGAPGAEPPSVEIVDAGPPGSQPPHGDARTQVYGPEGQTPSGVRASAGRPGAPRWAKPLAIGAPIVLLVAAAAVIVPLASQRDAVGPSGVPAPAGAVAPPGAPEQVADQSPGASAPPAPASEPRPAVSAVGDAAPSAPEPEQVEEARPPPTEAAAPRRTVKRGPLDVKQINRVVSDSRAPILRCFEQFKADLPSDQGQVAVEFTILSSGKVTGAGVTGAMAGTPVARCLEGRVAKLRFPAHTDEALKLALPFAYRVQR